MTVTGLVTAAPSLLKPDRASFAPIDFLTWRESQSLAVAPEFQRRSVWGRPAKAYLIDTLLRGLPVPPIYLRVRQSDDRTRLIREVIDGQQRISAVLDFLDGRFSLLPSFDSGWASKEYAELSPDEQDRIRTYPFVCEVFHGISDAQVLEIFARMNTFSVQLNAQELRNGRYFGWFKQTAYELARDHVEFWRYNRIITERGIARMEDAELTSELMVLQMDGLQDKKTSISKFYAEYDDVFPEREEVMVRFQSVIDTISESVESLASTEFRRRPLFYSLFGVIYHHHYGVPRVDIPTPRKALNAADRKSLRAALDRLTEVIVAAREDEPVPNEAVAFVNSSLRQTDNIQPRLARLRFLYDAVF
jgi:Protein of unknown function DUF262